MTTRLRGLARSAAMAAGLLVLSALGTVHDTWALERSQLVSTWLTDSRVYMLGELDGELYFSSQSQLWKTGGTPAGTVLLTNAVPLESWRENICPVGSTHFARAGTANRLLFFSADDGVHDQELWKSDGTPGGTALVKDINPSGFSLPRDFIDVNGTIYFTATQACCGIWKSDGTEAGTSFLADHRPPLGSLGSVYVFERNGELWRSDGTTPGTVLVRVINPSGGSSPIRLAQDNGKLYFFAQPGPKVWVTDGTTGGTQALFDALGGHAVMRCDAGICYFVEGTPNVTNLWRTDGTPGGTAKLGQLPGSSNNELIAASGMVAFTADRALWKTDGTAPGTALIYEDPQGILSALTFLDGALFFIVTRPGSGPDPHRELWRSDGTPAGTAMAADLGDSLNGPLVVIVNGTLVLGVWGPVLVDGVVSTDAWRIQQWDRRQAQLVTVAELARDAVHCPTPTCSCAMARKEESAVVGGKWYFHALDPQTFAPRLAVVTAVYFGDVGPDHWAFSWVETLAGAGLTSGCRDGAYCPAAAVSRAEMAVFLLRGIHGASFVPPGGTGTVFTDVPAGHWASGWIERLAAEGVTGGCGGGQYCPDRSVTRAEMAVFLLRAKHGAGYQPTAATGTMFTDVPASQPFAKWIEQLAREGITGGCDGGNYCPEDPVTREQMAVFLVRAFNLPM